MKLRLLHIIYLIVFCCGNSLLFALKPVEIEGYASFAKKKEIRFFLHDDLMSKRKTLIAKTTTDDSGFFSLKIPVLETRELILSINTTEGSIFVEPEKKYQIHISTNEELIHKVNATNLGNTLQISIQNSDSNELNYRIYYFNTYYNYFLYKHSLPILNMVKQSVYDSLIHILSDKFPINNNPNDFYSTYVKFRIAEVERMYYRKYPKKIYTKYLNNKYIYYYNPAYMDFFIAFFQNYIHSGSKQITKNILHQNINNIANYYELLDNLGKDPLLANEIIREMVLIENLKDMFSYPDEFNLVNILTLLKKSAENTKFSEHKKMAENTLEELKSLRKNTLAPNCTLKDIHNSIVTLDDYKGKHIFLHFFSTDCHECVREMLIIKDLYENYKQDIEIISIMLDFETTRLYHFVNAHPEFKWKFLHFNSDFSFIETYKLFSLPLGMIIDPEGYIVAYPTPPTTEIGYFFNSMFRINKQQISPK